MIGGFPTYLMPGETPQLGIRRVAGYGTDRYPKPPCRNTSRCSPSWQDKGAHKAQQSHDCRDRI